MEIPFNMDNGYGYFYGLETSKWLQDLLSHHHNKPIIATGTSQGLPTLPAALSVVGRRPRALLRQADPMGRRP